MKTLVLLMASTLAMMAADAAGEWKGTAETPNGTVERTFSLKVDGTKLTGETSSSFSGKSTIENGKVDGNNITFNLTANFQGNEMKLNYTGKMTGADTMELQSTIVGGDQGFAWKLKRAK